MYLNGRNILFAIIILIAGCTPEHISLDQFEFSGTWNQNIEIVVEGAIFSLYGKQYVKISQPGTWPENNNYPITGAQVSVEDGDNQYFYLHKDSIDLYESVGLYESVDSFAGIVGKTYKLTILYNGKTYTAEDKMVECDVSGIELPVEGIRYEDGIYAIEIFRHNFGYDKPFKIIWGRVYDSLFSENYSYILNTRILFASLIGNVTCHIGNPVNGVFNSERHLLPIWAPSTDEVTIYFMSISPEYYEFLLDYYEETHWSVGLFSTIPGNIRTNLS